MPVCCVFGCNNRSYRKNKFQMRKEENTKLSFHRFPRDPICLGAWLQFLSKPNWIPSRDHVICSEHFMERYFDRTSKASIRLRENAVPTIFKNQLANPEGATTSVPAKFENPQQDILMSSNVVSKNSQIFPCIENSNLESVEPNIPIISSVSNCQLPIKTARTPDVISSSNKNAEIRKFISRTTSFSPDRKARRPLSPSKVVLIKKMKNMESRYKNKIWMLQQSNRRQSKKIAALKNVISSLRNQIFLPEEHINILENMSSPNAQILKRQISKNKDSG